jgi:hypothetical protein
VHHDSTAQTGRDQGHQLEQDPPPGGVYAVASGQRIIMGVDTTLHDHAVAAPLTRDTSEITK